MQKFGKKSAKKSVKHSGKHFGKAPAQRPGSDAAKPKFSKSAFSRLQIGHPWIWRSEYELSSVAKGAVSEAALIPFGEHWFFYSPKSDIALRRFGPSERNWSGLRNQNGSDAEASTTSRHPITDLFEFESRFGSWLHQHLQSLYLKKQKRLDGDRCFRWVFSENDLLPGWIVDCYGANVVVQILTAPAEHFFSVFERTLRDVYHQIQSVHPRVIALRNAGTRKKEGLPIVESEDPRPDVYEWNGFKWWFSPGASQKTGAYFDQRNNHSEVALLAHELGLREAWDLCSFEGGFSIHLADRGCKVLAVDQSAAALRALRDNAELNHVAVQTEERDVFEFLKAANDYHRSCDLIVLDPPSFLKTRAQHDAALRAYRDLNLRAMKSLRPGGVLATFTCSQNVGWAEFEAMLRSAAHDARKPFRLLKRLGAAADHAPQVTFPEGEYLRGWILQAGE